MYRNGKQQGNYYSQPNLYNGTYMVPQPFSRISEQMYPRPQLQQRQIPMIEPQRQASLVLRNTPNRNNDYQLSPYVNNQDSLSDMQDYIASIYGKRKQKSANPQYSQSMLRQKQRLQQIVLPRILRSHQKCAKDRQKEEIKIMRNLENRYEGLQPQMQRVYNQARENYQIHQRQYQHLLNHQHQFQKEYSQCPQCAMRNWGGENVHHTHNNHKQAQQKPRGQFRISQKPRMSPQRRKRLLSRFRVYGYAVFFAVIFPDYSYLFGHYKLKQFLSKYLIQNNTYIQQMSMRLQQKLKTLPLYQQIRNIHQQYQNKNFNNNNNLTVKLSEQQPKIKITSQSTDQHYVINLNVFRNIVEMLLRSYLQLVDDLDDNELEFIGVGVMNAGYYGDGIYAVEEMAFINYHEEKAYINVSKKQQRGLLISNFVIKRIIHHHLLRLAVDPLWHEQLASLSTLNTHQAQFFKIICKQIQLAAYFFYQIAIKNFYLLIEPQKRKANFCNINDSAMPLTIKTMRFPPLIMTNQEKEIFSYQFGINQPKNTYIQIEKFNSKYDWKTNQHQTLQQYTQLIQDNPLNIIHNSSQFNELSHLITSSMSTAYDKIQHSMMKIVNRLHKNVTQIKKKNYRRYHEQVMRTKYILTKDHDILQGIVFLRSEEEKKIVSMNRRMLDIYVETLKDLEVQEKDQVNTLTNNRYLSTNKNRVKSKGTYQKKRIGSLVSIMLEESSKHNSFDSDRNRSKHKAAQVPFRRKRGD